MTKVDKVENSKPRTYDLWLRVTDSSIEVRFISTDGVVLTDWGRVTEISKIAPDRSPQEWHVDLHFTDEAMLRTFKPAHVRQLNHE